MAELAGAAIGPKAAIDPPGRVSVQPVSTE
jgi:hypothetical protein